VARREYGWVNSGGVAMELYRTGAVATRFMQDDIRRLCAALPAPIDKEAAQFLLDLLFLKIKPRRGRGLSKTLVRQAFDTRMDVARLRALFEAHGQSDASVTATPARIGEGSLAQKVMRSIADDLNVSYSTIEHIIYPRKERPAARRADARKPRISCVEWCCATAYRLLHRCNWSKRT